MITPRAELACLHSLNFFWTHNTYTQGSRLNHLEIREVARHLRLGKRKRLYSSLSRNGRWGALDYSTSTHLQQGTNALTYNEVPENSPTVRCRKTHLQLQVRRYIQGTCRITCTSDASQRDAQAVQLGTYLHIRCKYMTGRLGNESEATAQVLGRC
eukprot:Gb_29264 [translate_table: standard]